ncbi:MAG: bifunctional (p)ppGpp synthetase/guanosine-3',5'-bis(diphosphate) 3'-pyrophosphohydrolase [Magnetococcales bacterium]|nr:bifunctional (p)ppGpp synthetase/guanosine-3',5'-bis(diphosphate) 3'-pyrophosphohydrolase [Magnetococcales bacterium]
MPQWTQLVERIRGYQADADGGFLDRLRDFLLATRPLDGPSAGPLSPFSLGVAGILTELRLDTASLAAGLVAEAFTSGVVTEAQIEAALGQEVAFLVTGIHRLSLLNPPLQKTEQAENFRKMILALAKDIRVVLIRLALCLQQYRTAAALPEPPAQLVDRARDILEIYAPIAHRLGIFWIKNELEDLAFKISNPLQYEGLRAEIQERRKGGTDVVAKVVAILETLLARHGIVGSVSGREKHLYSVWCKLRRKNTTVDALHDLIAYRIIVPDKVDCYRALGMIHGELRPIPGRFKDYIALPKGNGYQSLHTACIGPFGNRIEIQIRTGQMHQVAESGVAAHWQYKATEQRPGDRDAITGYAWLKNLLEIHRNAKDPNQFLENVKIDLFPDELYLFTPAGEILTLPRGASPVDFAYAVHSQVGDRCHGCKVNGRLVPLRTVLKTGDTVEILTAKNQQPNPNWLQFVVSGKAKYCIGRWLKRQKRGQTIALGRELLERELRKAGHGRTLSERFLRTAADLFELADGDELLLQIGTSRLSPAAVSQRLFPDAAGHGSSRKPGAGEDWRGGAQGRPAHAPLRLNGLLSEIMTQAARCCAPVPGDTIIGLVTTGRGITIHAKGCPNLAQMEKKFPERLIREIEWPDEARGEHHVARLRAMVHNRKNILTRISEAVAGSQANILEARFQDPDREPCILILEVEVRGRDHLAQVQRSVAALADVLNVDRMRG